LGIFSAEVIEVATLPAMMIWLASDWKLHWLGLLLEPLRRHRHHSIDIVTMNASELAQLHQHLIKQALAGMTVSTCYQRYR
jgi:hypothetical protein